MSRVYLPFKERVASEWIEIRFPEKSTLTERLVWAQFFETLTDVDVLEYNGTTIYPIRKPEGGVVVCYALYIRKTNSKEKK